MKKKDIPFDDLIVPIDVHASRSRWVQGIDTVEIFGLLVLSEYSHGQ